MRFFPFLHQQLFWQGQGKRIASTATGFAKAAKPIYNS